MRTAFFLVILAACSSSDTGNSCTEDDQCGKDVCANDQTCEPASDVTLVHVTWTINGMPASATTCTNVPSLFLQFTDDNPEDTFGFDPVPCTEGVFTATKLPTMYNEVEMLNDQTQQVIATAAIASGAATLDLMP